MWTTPSELFWIKMDVIIEKTETYSETIIERRIQNPAFCENSWLYLTVD